MHCCRKLQSVHYGSPTIDRGSWLKLSNSEPSILASGLLVDKVTYVHVRYLNELGNNEVYIFLNIYNIKLVLQKTMLMKLNDVESYFFSVNEHLNK